MLTRHLALVWETDRPESHRHLTRVGAALQKQVTRDFAPIWNASATVNAFLRLDDVPIDYWPIIVMDDIGDPSAEGVHEDENHQPFALVHADDGWSLTASHECLEMLADPFGSRMVAGPSVDPKAHGSRVEYLVEVCDPCE